MKNFLMPVADEREDAGCRNHPKCGNSTKTAGSSHVRPPIYCAAQTIKPASLNVWAV